MRVWIDQDLCTGDGLCVDHCPDVFTQLEDGIAYVVEDGMVLNDPGSDPKDRRWAAEALMDIYKASLTLLQMNREQAKRRQAIATWPSEGEKS